MSPAAHHGLMIGFTLDWDLKPHSNGGYKGTIMVVFFFGGGVILVEKGIHANQIVR